MEDILTATKTTRRAIQTNEGPGKAASSKSFSPTLTIDSPDQALQILRAEPDLSLLSGVLIYLDPARSDVSGFKIKTPNPRAAQLINELVGNILPSYWRILNEKKAKGTSKKKTAWLYPVERRSLLDCLSSVTGLGAIVARLRLLVASFNASTSSAGGSDGAAHINEILTVLTEVLGQDDFIYITWTEINDTVSTQTQRIMLWKEYISLVASSKILSISAEANDVLNKTTGKMIEGHWIGNGAAYSGWIGRGVATMASKLGEDQQDGWKLLAQLFAKALSLGYVDQIVEKVFSGLIPKAKAFGDTFRRLLNFMLPHEQRNVLYSMLRILIKQHLPLSRSSGDDTLWQGDTAAIGSAASVISAIIVEESALKDELVRWLTGTPGGGIGEDINIRRVVIVLLRPDRERLQSVLDKSMKQFGDKLYIKHSPILHQEVIVQILLLSAGYIHQSFPMYLATLAQSSIYLNSISNRLAASSSRARFLGMVVGVAISELIDKADKRMDFGTDELDNPDARWYKSLIRVHDEVGALESHEMFRKTNPEKVSKSSALSVRKGHKTLATDVKRQFASNHPNQSIQDTNIASARNTSLTKPTSKIISIEEIEDEEEGSTSSEDLVPYEKPDSDPEDEDEDPTLVQRNKPTAPVYIRDLIAGLRDTDNYDRYKLCVSTAHILIRRKASFGTEVLDHAEELATILTGLSDKYDMEDFTKWRLQGMISILVSVPEKLGPWFSKTFFDGDYSMSQRASILSTLGMGARELAGYSANDAALTGASSAAESAFPSKKLPEKLHKIYAIEQASPVNALAQSLERTMIEPMAVSAAESLSGPNALKVRTFSSRMAVEKAKKPPVSNKLSKLVAESFFFPLTGRWSVHVRTSAPNSSHRTPFLLSSYLKTLALILHASGSSTPSLPQMTSELWDLLLSLRSWPSTTSASTSSSSSNDDSTVLEALLFALLTLLETNNTNKRQLAEAHSKELLETREWAQVIFENVRGGDDEGDRVRMLAASVLVRAGEVVDEFQRLLMGDMVGF